jgi:hypothetical protein
MRLSQCLRLIALYPVKTKKPAAIQAPKFLIIQSLQVSFEQVQKKKRIQKRKTGSSQHETANTKNLYLIEKERKSENPLPRINKKKHSILNVCFYFDFIRI